MSLLVSNIVCKSIPPDSIYWNKLVKRKFNSGNPEQAIQTYVSMVESGFRADDYCFPIVLKAAASLSMSSTGLMLHAQITKTGFGEHLIVQTALLNMYRMLKRLDDACKVFEKMPERDVIASNSMLDGFASCGQMDHAKKLFDSMTVKDITSFNIMIAGYAKIGDTCSARRVFDSILVKDVVSWNSLLLACTNAGNMEMAREIFEQMQAKDDVTWNTMITGCLSYQLYPEVISLFDEMQAANCKPDYLTVTSILSACAHLGSLQTGIEVHVYALENGLASSPHVTTALIHMYSKCGSIQQSLKVFYISSVKDSYCWSAMISALALHGQGHAALKLVNNMKECNVRIDDVTFIGVLSACSHSGLVQEGCELFSRMEKEFGIIPKVEHYSCLVDVLGRAGLVDQAMELVKAMPYEPTASVLGALLSSCVMHRDLEMGERVVKLISSKADQLSDGELMMFSNLYASCNQWEEANKWRDLMNDTGITKTAGWSAVEVDGTYYKFLAGEQQYDTNET